MKGADLLKFLLSLVVVWIHTGNNDLNGLLNWAVHIFFFLSGFFLFGKIIYAHACTSEVISKWLRKTLRMYLVWTAIYLPFAIIGFASEGMPFVKAVAVYLRNVVFVGENYLSWPLWYLLGLLQAGVVIWCAQRIHVPFWGLCAVAALLFCLPYLIHFEETGIYHKVFVNTRNGFFIGFPCMVMGGIFRKLFPGITGWPNDSRFFKPALAFRFFSIHIYLTHMLFAGLLMLLWSPERGIGLWGITCLMTIVSGMIFYFFPRLQKVLYGRQYRVV